MNVPLRILLIEDSADDAALLLRQLLRGGFEPTHRRVDTASEMSAALDAQEWDVIIADYVMPQFSGPAALALMKERGLDLPFLIVSGSIGEDVAVAAMKAGAHDYVLKGNLTRLAPAVERELREAQARRDQRRARQAEEERDNLRKAISAQEKVLGVVSHELRTPLAAARAMAEYLLSDGAQDQGLLDHFLRSIHDEVVRMSAMVNGLLEVARLNSGAARWMWEEVRIADVCEAALDPIRSLIQNDKVRLVAEIDDNLAMRGDADAIRRLVLNLTSNALKFTPQGFVHVLAKASPADVNERWVEISVHDTGRGMSAETTARLGEAFALNTGAVDEGEAKGVGLGLAICKGIAAAHGGTISFASAPGRGTTVTVRLRTDLPEPVRDSRDCEVIKVVAYEDGPCRGRHGVIS